ncbi:hypothetical protein PRZ48_013716 [Zasmidium cellare]|uniref:Enoyl reductase (ER) domain-containing protein n=1 Tax=Zasmidium cellare TaxID=395010 RepID=A0ABR0E279_ZASCE|nr:hypothetical protein PRZ48_013716 [Zasmidium cellare]
MSTHLAAFLDAVAQPLRIGPVPTPSPAAGEILIQNRALAINPIDWKQQSHGVYIASYPTILGTDSAGIIAAVGSEVTRFKVGQRVIGHGITLATKNIANGAFQEYTICPEAAVAAIPDSMSFEDAVVLPLAISTAAAGLFEKKHLGLEYPDTPGDRSKKTILVWGGSSSVGSLAIQMARAAGYRVLATASERNLEFVEGLGAMGFDYQAEGVLGRILGEVGRGEFWGAYDVFAPTVFLAEPEVGKAIWQEFLPKALADGRIKPTPKADVFGTGLEAIQGAMEKHKAGVSASKIVVSL